MRLSGDGCGGADAHGCEVLLVDAGHDPDRGQVSNGKEFLRRIHNQSKICGAGKHYSVDRRGHDKVRIDLFGLLERSDLPVAGAKQLQLFEGRTYIRFMTSMHRLHLFLLLLTGGSALDQVLRAHQFFVLGFQLGQARKALCFRLRAVAAKENAQELAALAVLPQTHRNFTHATGAGRPSGCAAGGPGATASCPVLAWMCISGLARASLLRWCTTRGAQDAQVIPLSARYAVGTALFRASLLPGGLVVAGRLKGGSDI